MQASITVEVVQASVISKTDSVTRTFSSVVNTGLFDNDVPRAVCEAKCSLLSAFRAASMFPLYGTIQCTQLEDTITPEHAPRRSGNINSTSLTTKSTEDKTNSLYDICEVGAQTTSSAEDSTCHHLLTSLNSHQHASSQMKYPLIEVSNAQVVMSCTCGWLKTASVRIHVEVQITPDNHYDNTSGATLDVQPFPAEGGEKRSDVGSRSSWHTCLTEEHTLPATELKESSNCVKVIVEGPQPADKNLKTSNSDSRDTSVEYPGPGDPTPCDLAMKMFAVCAVMSKEPQDITSLAFVLLSTHYASCNYISWRSLVCVSPFTLEPSKCTIRYESKDAEKYWETTYDVTSHHCKTKNMGIAVAPDWVKPDQHVYPVCTGDGSSGGKGWGSVPSDHTTKQYLVSVESYNAITQTLKISATRIDAPDEHTEKNNSHVTVSLDIVDDITSYVPSLVQSFDLPTVDPYMPTDVI